MEGLEYMQLAQSQYRWKIEEGVKEMGSREVDGATLESQGPAQIR